MPLETLHAELLSNLKQKGATPRQIVEWDAKWKHALSHSGEPLPCPICFLEGEVARVGPGKTYGDVATAACHRCGTVFEFMDDNGR